ncbi:MAG: tetratricopeptide repeat protein [Bacteroidaceae bacterium]|nr:tetratricopeptide repeat protein [Bacteroidaceae bacterium]
MAQQQQGYVKTLGRPDKKGEPLSGVTVLVKGEHNTVLSKADGTFSMLMTGKKNGDVHSLQQVQKSGYELNEKGVIGRKYAFSDKVPLTLVMVSTSQLQADKQRIENTAYEVAQRNYQKKMAELERQRDKNTITAETYRSEAADLREKFERYQLLIDGLAEHYAHTDYDLLTDTEREINLCIEAGDLDRADSLIHTLFAPTDVLQSNHDALAKIDQQIDQTKDIIRQANTDMAAVLKQQEKDAEYLYQLYTIALAKYDNEKARYYIETRAALDTTNLKWQNDTGRFIHDYLADYSTSLNYFQLVLRQSLVQEGEESAWVGTAYNNIGGVYSHQGNYPKALEYYSKALTVWEKVLGMENPDVALSYNNIGAIYYHQGDYSKSLEYYSKALIIWEKLQGTEHLDVALSYNNIGAAYAEQGNYLKALEYLFKALAIREKILGKEHPNVALSYNNIGYVYIEQGDYPKALRYHFEALAIREKVLGKEHPDVAQSYNNIGVVYYCQGDHRLALEYLSKSLAIREKVLGPIHPNTKIVRENIEDVKQEMNAQ